MKLDEIIHRKLTESLAPTRLEVINESHLHIGHVGDNGTGESHYRVVVVSPHLSGFSRVESQRKIYKILSEEMKNRIHALSINVLEE
ncbi:MAG TPA: BolA family protein [Micavibrio sp.]|jgi:BolA protein